MQEQGRYRAVIIESDSTTRNRLKQAAVELHEFKKIEFATNLRAAHERLSHDEQGSIDVFFISYRFEAAKVRKFIEQAKQTLIGVDAAYIMLMKNFDQTGAAIAARLLEGADGLLQEPYSTDGLKEVNEIAARVKLERAAYKATLAVRMLVKDVAKRMEIYAFLKRMRLDTGPALKSLRESCAQVHALTPESKEAYLIEAVEVFSDFPLLYSPFERYDGASKRVRKDMSRWITHDYEGKLEE